jgi:hypothetical protein
MGDVKCQLDKDFTTVTEWGESCPSLVEITLPRECHRRLILLLLEYFIDRLFFLVDSNGLSWYKISNTLWIPDPRHNTAITWLRDAMVLKRFRWDLMSDELDQTLCKSTTNPSEYTETITAVRHRFGTLLRGKNGDTTRASTLTDCIRGESTIDPSA